MKIQLIAGCCLLCLLSACATNSSSSSNQQSTTTTEINPEKVEKAARGAAHVVIMTTAGTPLKVISAAGTAARVVKDKVEGDDTQSNTQPN